MRPGYTGDLIAAVAGSLLKKKNNVNAETERTQQICSTLSGDENLQLADHLGTATTGRGAFASGESATGSMDFFRQRRKSKRRGR